MNKLNVHEVQEASDDYSNRKIKIFGFQNARNNYHFVAIEISCLNFTDLYTPS
jgi:hypothetical protein